MLITPQVISRFITTQFVLFAFHNLKCAVRGWLTAQCDNIIIMHILNPNSYHSMCHLNDIKRKKKHLYVHAKWDRYGSLFINCDKGRCWVKWLWGHNFPLWVELLFKTALADFVCQIRSWLLRRHIGDHFAKDNVVNSSCPEDMEQH